MQVATFNRFKKKKNVCTNHKMCIYRKTNKWKLITLFFVFFLITQGFRFYTIQACCRWARFCKNSWHRPSFLHIVKLEDLVGTTDISWNRIQHHPGTQMPNITALSAVTQQLLRALGVKWHCAPTVSIRRRIPAQAAGKRTGRASHQSVSLPQIRGIPRGR